MNFQIWLPTGVQMMSKLKLSNVTTRSFTVVLGITLGLFTLTLALHARAQEGQGRKKTMTEVNENRVNDSETRIRYSDDKHSVEIKARESLEFSDDDADIKNVSRNGYLMIEERRGSMSRKFEVVPGADGQPQRAFYVQGQPHPLDREGRAWLAEILPDVIRNTAIGAQARVKRIMRQRGPGGVLDEISLIKSDGAKRIYFRELLNNGNPDTNTLRRAARQMAREISSDGEKANLLKESADLYLDNERVAPDFFEAINSVSSDGERRLVLSVVLKKNLNDANVTRAANSARPMSSDGEKATLLVQHSDVFLHHPSAIPAFFETINSISSDGEHARVLSSLLKRRELSKDTLMRLIRSAEKISSDGEKANVLVNAVRVYASDGAALSAIADAAKTISSDGEKQRVLSALARQRQ
jgi:hypothetical protein